MKPAALLALAALVVAAPALAQQPTDFSQVRIKTTDLGKNLYMLEGAGGNITVAVARDGIVMVDGQFAPLHDKIKAAISAISRQPIRYLVNTHFHGDHTGGNEAFAHDGALVVANRHVQERLAEGTTNGLTGAKTPPAAKGALPGRIYRRALSLRLRGIVAHLRHPPRAHTDGDTYVWFKVPNVLATGDIFTRGRYPNIDVANGGTIKGMIAAVDAFLALVNDTTKIVPGHGRLATKSDLVEYRKMLGDAQDRVAKLIEEGKSEADAVAAKPFADFDARLGANEQAAANFIRVVYRSLAEKPA